MWALTSAAWAPRRAAVRPARSCRPPGRFRPCASAPKTRNLRLRACTGGSEHAVERGAGVSRPLLALERAAHRHERSVERDLDGVRAQPQDSGDLLRGQVGSEAKRDQLLIALRQLAHCGAQLEPRRDLLLER